MSIYNVWKSGTGQHISTYTWSYIMAKIKRISKDSMVGLSGRGEIWRDNHAHIEGKHEGTTIYIGSGRDQVA